MTPTWKYRCSLCGALIVPDDVAAHTLEERAKPGWPGSMSLTRVDDDDPYGGVPPTHAFVPPVIP